MLTLNTARKHGLPGGSTGIGQSLAREDLVGANEMKQSAVNS